MKAASLDVLRQHWRPVDFHVVTGLKEEEQEYVSRVMSRRTSEMVVASSALHDSPQKNFGISVSQLSLAAQLSFAALC